MAGVSQPETAPTRFAEPLATTSRRVVVCVNRRAGAPWRRRRVAEIEAALRASGYDVSMTRELDEMDRLVVDSAGPPPRAVIALGGDGTVSCVRNRVPLDVPVLPVPMGTENLLGRYVGQRVEGSAVRQTLDRGVVIGLDLGRANGKYFLLMISAGFDAEVIRRLHEKRRGNITRATYFKPTLETIRSYKYPKLQIYCGPDAGKAAKPSECRWVFGFSLPLYALGWQIAPKANGIDGVLDVCMFERGSLWQGLRYLWHVIEGSHLTLSDVNLVRGRHVRIEAENGEVVPFQLDGDYAGNLPVDVEVLPGALKLLVSRSAAVRLGFELP